MPPKQEEAFEMVLGSKQLLSLFFLAVVLFAVFFSFGYMIGFGRGQQNRATTIVSAELLDEPQSDAVRLPDTLLEKAPIPFDPQAEIVRVSESARVVAVPPQPEHQAPVVAELPNPAATSEPPPKAPEKRPAALVISSGSVVAHSIHLQVAASRVEKDAQTLVENLKGGGYRAALYDAGDGWFRIVVGPFHNEAAAKVDQKRLTTDGLDSLLHR